MIEHVNNDYFGHNPNWCWNNPDKEDYISKHARSSKLPETYLAAAWIHPAQSLSHLKNRILFNFCINPEVLSHPIPPSISKRRDSLIPHLLSFSKLPSAAICEWNAASASSASCLGRQSYAFVNTKPTVAAFRRKVVAIISMRKAPE